MKRRWFADDDGTYYRNCPLILEEMEQSVGTWRFVPLHRELAKAKRNVLRKPQLGRGDVLAQPRSFREAYPETPGLWILDDAS